MAWPCASLRRNKLQVNSEKRVVVIGVHLVGAMSGVERDSLVSFEVGNCRVGPTLNQPCLVTTRQFSKIEGTAGPDAVQGKRVPRVPPLAGGTLFSGGIAQKSRNFLVYLDISAIDRVV